MNDLEKKLSFVSSLKKMQWTYGGWEKGEKRKVKARFGEDPMFSKLFNLETNVFRQMGLRCGKKGRKTVVESSWKQDGGSGGRSGRFGEDPTFSKVFCLRTAVFLPQRTRIVRKRKEDGRRKHDLEKILSFRRSSGCSHS